MSNVPHIIVYFLLDLHLVVSELRVSSNPFGQSAVLTAAPSTVSPHFTFLDEHGETSLQPPLIIGGVRVERSVDIFADLDKRNQYQSHEDLGRGLSAFNHGSHRTDGSRPERSCRDDAQIMHELLESNTTTYDRNKLPDMGVDVQVEMWIQEVSKIIEFTSEFELDLYVTEQWVDRRLSFSHLDPCKANISVDGSTILPKIWTPRACFVNSKNATIHRSPFTNIFLMFYANGTVWVNYRIKLVGPCKKDLKTFPIDEQSCVLVYESFTHNYEEVRMQWTEMTEPVLMLKDIRLPDYTLVTHSATAIKRLYPPGVWNELIATFTFQRRYGFYILQAYVPAYLSVFISWVGFYLGANNLASRTVVGVNALLSLTFQFGTIVQNLPRSSDVKAIDVWILSCMSFIFATLIELALIGYITRWNVNNGVRCSCSWLCMECPYWTANKIDGLSMIAFPTCFLLFNLYYWGVFLG